MAFPLDPARRVWRIVRNSFPVLDGRGAALHGGRWNSPGRPVVYASESFALALLERLVYLPTGRIPANQVFAAIRIPTDLPAEAAAVDAVPGWDGGDHRASRAYGDAWHDERRTAVLYVPSVVTRLDRNVVINPEHPDFPGIEVDPPAPVAWDARLFARRP